ncbi:MAG: hypothetical protein JJ975_14405 [Bacteroidia bacterium]|nr:hypothetical protein [Bacteroidia bacterium]
MFHDKHKSPLADKFEHFELKTSRSSFEAFERNTKKKTSYSLAVDLLLVLIIGTGFFRGNTLTKPDSPQTLPFTYASEPTPGNSVQLGTSDTGVFGPSYNDSSIQNKPTQQEAFATTKDYPAPEEKLKSSTTKQIEDSRTSNREHAFELLELTFHRYFRQNAPGILNFSYSIPPEADLLEFPGALLSLVPGTQQVSDKASNDLIGPPSSKWQLGLQSGILLSWQKTRAANAQSSEYVHTDYLKQLHQAQSPSLGFQTNLFVSYKALKIGGIRSGLTITQFGNSGTYNFRLDSIPVYDLDNTIAGYVPASDTMETIQGSSGQSFAYLGIPFGFQTSLWSGRNFQVLLTPSAQLEFLIDQKGSVLNELDLTDIKAINRNDLNLVNFSYSFELTCLKRLNDRMTLGGSLNFVQKVSPFNKLDYYRTYGRGIGLNFNLLYSI